MSLHEEMRLFTELSGEDGVHTSIARIGGYLDGYERGKADSKWIPCSERFPEPRIDVWCNSDLGQTVGYYDETCDMWLRNDYTELIVTAWRPLPEPYKGEEE